MRGRIILSLCDRTGNWPHYYAEAGYEVRLYDLATTGQDVRLLPAPDGPVHGILAAPPCTVFANSGNRWPRTPEEMREGLSIVDACLRIVCACRPVWWALENPVGKLKRYLGEPTMRFDPCDFGDAYRKRTCLWGHFVPPAPLFGGAQAVKPERVSAQGSWIQKLGGSGGERTRAARSATPLGFAHAFFLANP